MSDAFSNPTADFKPITHAQIVSLFANIDGAIVEIAMWDASHPQVIAVAEAIVSMIPGGAAVVPVANVAIKVLGVLAAIISETQATS